MIEVVCGALVREGRVLLVHRRPDKRAFPNVWDLPGGVVEPDESLLGALARELHEELGVEVDVSSASHLCRLTAKVADERVQLDAWLLRTWRGTPVNVATEEHDDLGWFGREELPPLAHAVVRAALVDVLSGE